MDRAQSTLVIALVVFAGSTGVAVSTLVIMAYDRPFSGGVLVTPHALLEVMPD